MLFIRDNEADDNECDDDDETEPGEDAFDVHGTSIRKRGREVKNFCIPKVWLSELVEQRECIKISIKELVQLL